MGAKKRKVDLENEGTPFDELSKVIQIEPDPVDLQSKIRTFESKRNNKREQINGAAVLLDLKEKILSRAEFRNISHDGVSLEVRDIQIKPNDDVLVHFSTGVNIGSVQCTVQWVVNIQGHRKQHKLLGLKFKELPPVRRRKLDEFIEKLRQGRRHDPFYGL